MSSLDPVTRFGLVRVFRTCIRVYRLSHLVVKASEPLLRDTGDILGGSGDPKMNLVPADRSS